MGIGWTLLNCGKEKLFDSMGEDCRNWVAIEKPVDFVSIDFGEPRVSVEYVYKEDILLELSFSVDKYIRPIEPDRPDAPAFAT